jgi:hypothetical protein
MVQCCTSLCMQLEKKDVFDTVASCVCTTWSSHGCCWNNSLIKHFWGLQTNENLTEQGHGYMVNVIRCQSVGAGVCQQWPAVWGQALLCNNTTPLTVVLWVTRFSFSCSHYNIHWLASHPFPDNAQRMVPANLRNNIIITFPIVGWDLNLFLTGYVKCFHALTLLSGSW